MSAEALLSFAWWFCMVLVFIGISVNLVGLFEELVARMIDDDEHL